MNVFSTFLVTQTVLRFMMHKMQGNVIMIPGVLGKSVMKNSSVYSASKFAVTGFTKASRTLKQPDKEKAPVFIGAFKVNSE